jgi:NAD-dependent deacetylase
LPVSTDLMLDLARAAELLSNARHGVALTGAGVSTESGLPDFRSSSGLWAGVDPTEVATMTAFRRSPEKFYDFYRSRLAMLAGALPNPAHLALVDLETNGMMVAVVTQNIDGLHQAAGSRRVIELHGNLREAACPDCGWIGPIAVVTEALAQKRLPGCGRCGRRVKPNVVLFEELLPLGAYEEAQNVCRSADLLLIVGSSLQVTPAARLPVAPVQRGVPLIIVNDEPTPFDELASVVLHGRAGQILPTLVSRAAARRESLR